MGNGFQAQDRFADGAQYIGGRLRPGTSGRQPGRGRPGHGPHRSSATNWRAPTTSTPPWPRPARRSPAGRGSPRANGPRRCTASPPYSPSGPRTSRTPSPCSAASRSSSPREFDVPGTVDNASFFAGAARHLEGKSAAEYSGDHTSYVRREALGVVGSIAPWNYPLQMAAWKILPAVAAGNTIVLKPAEITPLTSLMFAQAATEAGIPDGVINIVSGAGQDAGEHLVGHPDVVMTSFTGSTAVGKRVAELATATVKRLHLELGGKAPFLVFDDADLDAAVHGAVAGCPHQHRPGLHRRHPRLRAAPPVRRVRERASPP